MSKNDSWTMRFSDAGQKHGETKSYNYKVNDELFDAIDEWIADIAYIREVHSTALAGSRTEYDITQSRIKHTFRRKRTAQEQRGSNDNRRNS